MLSKKDKKMRSSGIGSSEIAMLIYLPDQYGDPKPLSKFGNRHKLWRIKTGKEPEKEAESFMDRGTFIEKGLIDWYAHDHNVDWMKPPTIKSKKYPYVVDSCDGLTFTKGKKKKSQPLRCIEAKAITAWSKDEWGQPGTDEIPEHYLVQCQWHLGSHETLDNICDVPMDDGAKRTDYHVAFDEELYLALVLEAEKFWTDYVLKDKEPPIDSYSETTDWLSKYLKNKAGMGVLEANDQQIKLMLNYKDLALRIKKDEESLAKIKEAIQREIGEYDGIIIPDSKRKILWKKSKDTISVDWESVAKKLGENIDLDEFVDLQKSFPKIRKGSRRWTPTTLLGG